MPFVIRQAGGRGALLVVAGLISLILLAGCSTPSIPADEGVGPTITSDGTPPPPAPTPTPLPDGSLAPTPTPTPTPAPGPREFVTIGDYKVAVVQTTQQPSATQADWTNITLDLAIVREGSDSLDLQVEGASGCLSGTECFTIGLQGATPAEAQLESLMESIVSWPLGKVWPQTVNFDVPPDVTSATFIFNDESFPIELNGDRVALPIIQVLALAPTPDNSTTTDGTAGYFVHTDYGVAITRVSGQQHSLLPHRKVIRVEMTLLSQAGDGLGAVEWKQVNGQTCFVGGAGNECLTLEWSGGENFEAALQLLEGDTPLTGAGVVARPRGLGWDFSATFAIPEDTGDVTLVFGDSRMALDVRGMTGSKPAWAYRQQYPELATGTQVFSFGSKTVTLRAIEPVPNDGDIRLIFDASQGVGETSDFRPVVSIDGSRIADSGRIIDGLSAGTATNTTFSPPTTSVTPPTIPPGGSTSFELILPRVLDDVFESIAFSDDRPDVVIASISVSDTLSTAPPQEAPAGIVNFARHDDEERFWLPDIIIESMTWTPLNPSAAERVTVEIVLSNPTKFGVENARTVFRANGLSPSSGGVTVGPRGTTTVKEVFLGWDFINELSFEVDSSNRIHEVDETNNTIVLPYEGVRNPDFRIKSITRRVDGISRIVRSRVAPISFTGVFQSVPYVQDQENPSLGETVIFSVEVENVGPGDGAFTFVFDDLPPEGFGSQASFWSRGVLRGNVETSASLGAGEVMLIDDIVFWSLGRPLTFAATVSSRNARVREVDETNNVMTFDHAAELLPDLVITSVVEAAHETLPGVFTYTATIENQGPGIAIPREFDELSLIISFKISSGDTSPFPVRHFVQTVTSDSGPFFIPVGGTVVVVFEVETDGTETGAIHADRWIDSIGQWWATNFLEVDEQNNRNSFRSSYTAPDS